MEETKIVKLLSKYEHALNDSNTQAAVDLYSDDGIFMPSEAPTTQGREQLLAAYDYVFKQIKLNIKFTVEELRVNGNSAFARTISRGQVTVLANGMKAPEENREFFLLEKIDGEWKIARYMFNKNRPAKQ